jgi:hypothetical protein
MKRILVCTTLVGLATVACSLLAQAPNPDAHPQAVASSEASSPQNLPAPDILVKTHESTPAPSPQLTDTPQLPTATIEPSGIAVQPVGLGMDARCGDSFIARVSNPPEITKDLFEHHAQGTFLIVILEMQNLTGQPIQIWDGDYFVDGIVNGKTQEYTPHKAATGYLFITRGNNLNQDQIKPGLSWKTYLAFDVPVGGAGWTLVVKPGYEINQQICEARIALTP